MLEPGSSADFPEEPLSAERRGELGVQQLERNLPIVAEILGEPDSRHPATAELALEPVAVAQGFAERRLGVGQRQHLVEVLEFSAGSARAPRP
jgi:hypothetical protein